jgi:hypothetical protein
MGMESPETAEEADDSCCAGLDSPLAAGVRLERPSQAVVPLPGMDEMRATL